MNNISENSLIVAVFIALICLPIYIVKLNTKKRKKAALEKTLQQITQEQQFLIETRDIINNLVIALGQGRLLIYNMLENSYKIYILNELSDVIKQDTHQQGNIRVIGLVLKHKNGESATVSFYRQYTDSESSLKRAEQLTVKWLQVLSNAG